MLVIDFLGQDELFDQLGVARSGDWQLFFIPHSPHPPPPANAFCLFHCTSYDEGRRKTRSCAGASQARRRALGRGDDAKCPVAEQRVDRLGSPKAESMPLKDRPTPPLCNQYLKFISLCSQALVISIYLYTSYFFCFVLAQVYFSLFLPCHF